MHDICYLRIYTERKLDHGPLKVTTEFTWWGKAGGLGRSEVTGDHKYGVQGTLRAELNKTKKQKTVPHYSRSNRTYEDSASGIALNSRSSSRDTSDSQAVGSSGKGQWGAEPRTHACVWTCEGRGPVSPAERTPTCLFLRLVPEVSCKG